MGALVGLGVGRRAAAGLVGVRRCRAQPPSRDGAAGRVRPAARAAPGSARSRRRRSSRCAWCSRCVVGAGRCRWSRGTPPVARGRSARWAAYLPVAVVVRARPAAPARARRGVARGRRQPRLRACGPGCRCPTRWPASAVRGPEPLRAGVRRVRARLPGHRPVRREPRPAQGPPGRPGRRPRRRGAAGRPRGRRRRARPAAAQPVRLPARRRRAPAPSSRRARPGRSTAPGWRSPRRGWCCC